MLNVSLGEFLGRLDAPAGEDLIGVVVMMMVMMAAAAMLVVVIMVVVVMMLMLVFIIVIVVMMMLMLVFIIVVVIMMMAAAAMLIMVIIVVVVMMVFVLLFLVLVGVLLVGLGSHSDQLSLEVVLGGHGLQDLLAGQGVPGGGDDGSGGVLLTQHGHSGGDLFLGGVLGAAQDDAACVADLVVVELTEVLHIHLDLVDVGHGNEAAQLNIQMLGHALDSAGHVGQLADAGGLDNDAVGVVLLHHLLQSGAEIAHQRAADAAGVQLIDLDAGLLQKAAVDADLAELVLDEHDLLACKGLFDELLDKGGLTGAKEAGENINFGHSLKCLFLLCRPVGPYKQSGPLSADP